jgi:dTDP-L-rhamnose 4-epimerase
MKKVLVTGGAGFIGSHIVDALIERGYAVRVFDSLDPQVHPTHAAPDYLNPAAEFVLGDMRDKDALARALNGIDVVFHQAAVVGVGQSMYEIRRYVDNNTLGVSNLLQVLIDRQPTIEKLIVASSMSIYGEGKYECVRCGVVFPGLRAEQQLVVHDWEMRCPQCAEPVQPLGTDEDKPLFPTSIYAITKRDHEEMCLAVGRAYGIPTVALRYFNAYGPRQALSNPYTGIAAIFSSRVLNGNPPLIFEDGLQTRDFVHVKDIVQANLLALVNPNADYEVFNVGAGRPTSILDVARILAKQLGRPDLEPQIVRRFRAGDIRHCYADISKIRERIGYEPRVNFESGIEDLIQWVMHQSGVSDRVALAQQQLDHRGLIR